MENLYHYTDFNAMRGIITNGEIWLWNLRRMNDSQEMQYFIKELKLAVKNQIEPSDYQKMEQLFDINLKNFDKLSSYASCFSEYADDAAQWSRYSKNGQGVCIAFNKELLKKIGDAGHTPLCKVSYSKNCDDLEIVKKLGYKYSDLFNEVCIGPQARVTKDVLADYFESTGMKDLCDKIKLSECPLRRF